MRRFFSYVVFLAGVLSISSCKPVQNLPLFSRVKIHYGTLDKFSYSQVKPLVPEKYRARLESLRYTNFTVHYTINNETGERIIEIDDNLEDDDLGKIVIRDAIEDGHYLRWNGAALPDSVTIDGEKVPKECLEGLRNFPGWKRALARAYLESIK